MTVGMADATDSTRRGEMVPRRGKRPPAAFREGDCLPTARPHVTSECPEGSRHYHIWQTSRGMCPCTLANARQIFCVRDMQNMQLWQRLTALRVSNLYYYKLLHVLDLKCAAD